jgi:CO/xanthine dehydrogenase Mo-binding subunit
LHDRIVAFAAEHSGAPTEACTLEDDAVLCDGRRISLAEIHVAAERAGRRMESMRKASNAPRSIAFNVQGFRVAVHRQTGKVRILQSVHAADAGVVINPMQCIGQVQGSVTQAVGWALYEKMVFDDEGRMINPAFRNYHIPHFADSPRTEVHFASTHDAFGPLGAKSAAEGAFDPVAPALANAIANATGLRFHSLPLAPDRIYRAIADKFEGSADPSV